MGNPRGLQGVRSRRSMENVEEKWNANDRGSKRKRVGPPSELPKVLARDSKVRAGNREQGIKGSKQTDKKKDGYTSREK